MRPLDPRLLQHARATRPYLAATAALGAVTAGLVVAQATLLADSLASTFLDGADLRRLQPTLLWLAVVVVARALVHGLQETVSRVTATRVQAQLREGLVRRALDLGPAWLAGQRSAELTTLATRGITALDGYFARYLPQLVLAGIVPVVVLARLLPADITAFLTVLVTLPLIPVFMALVGMTTQDRTRRQWRQLALLGHHFLDVVGGLTTLKVYGRARRQVQVVAQVTADYRRATMATLRLAFLSSLVLEVLATLSVALVAVGIGLRLLEGHLDLRTALLVLVLAPEAYLPLRMLGASYHASAEGLAAAEQVLAVLDERPAAATAALPVPDLSLASIRLTGVVVQHEGRGAPSLDGVDLVVRPGEMVAVTGPSGAGKSTLLSVMLGFTRPCSGSTTVGGVGLSDLDLAAWRDRLAYVPQHPHLVVGTVADNVRLGAPRATDADVRAALHEAGGLDTELADGADTVLGEDGAGLSVGQVRRVALARALVRQRPLLLLDEPTAGLDAASEARVARTLLGRPPGQTVVVVTHRPALLAAADRVVELAAPRLPQVAS